MWDIKSFSTVPQCIRVKTEKARGGEKKKSDKIKRRSGRVSETGKGRRGGADEKSKRREGNSHYCELIKYFSEGRIEGH